MSSSKGFTVIEIIVVVLLLAMVGGGVYIWQQSTMQKADESHQHHAAASPNPTHSASDSFPTPTPTPAVETSTWKFPYNDFSFKYPSSWDVVIADYSDRVVYNLVIKRQGERVMEMHIAPWGMTGPFDESKLEYKSIPTGSLSEAKFARWSIVSERTDDDWGGVFRFADELGGNPVDISVVLNGVDDELKYQILASMTNVGDQIFP